MINKLTNCYDLRPVRVRYNIFNFLFISFVDDIAIIGDMFVLCIAISLCLNGVFGVASTPLVFDSITFNGELMALYRLNYLNSVVDYFVLTECLEAFSGKKRDFYYLDRMREFYKVVPKEKIIELRYDTFPATVSKEPIRYMQYSENWHKEYFLRNIAKDAVLEKAKGKPFVLIVSDGDEMPSREAVKMLRSKYDEIGDEQVLLHLAYFWYNFKWQVPRENDWSIAYAITDQLWKKEKAVTLEFLRKRSYISKYFLRQAGWHCSWCMTVEDIMNKFNSFSHQETNKPEYNNKASISRCIDSGSHISGVNNQHAQTYNGGHGYPLPCDSCVLIPNVTVLHIPFPVHENNTSSSSSSSSSAAAVVHKHANVNKPHTPEFVINPKYLSSGSQSWKKWWDEKSLVAE